MASLQPLAPLSMVTRSTARPSRRERRPSGWAHRPLLAAFSAQRSVLPSEKPGLFGTTHTARSHRPPPALLTENIPLLRGQEGDLGPAWCVTQGSAPGHPSLRRPRLGSEGAAPATGRLFLQRRAAILPQGLLGVKGVSGEDRGFVRDPDAGNASCARAYVCTCASAWGGTVSLCRMGLSGWLLLRRGGECAQPSSGFPLPACPGGWPGGAEQSFSPPSGKEEARGDGDRIEGSGSQTAPWPNQDTELNSRPPQAHTRPPTQTVTTGALGCLCLRHLALWDLGSRASFPATLRCDLPQKIGVRVCQGEEGAMPPRLPPTPLSQTFRGSSCKNFIAPN